MPSGSSDLLSISPTVLTLFVVVILAVAFAKMAVIIVPENRRVVIFRLGRSIGTRGPGIVTILPFIDLVVWVDLHMAFRFAIAGLVTADSQGLACSIALEGRVTDPEKCVVSVPNLEKALYEVISRELAEIIRNKGHDEFVSQREWAQAQLQEGAGRSSRSFGFEVKQLTIGDIQ